MTWISRKLVGLIVCSAVPAFAQASPTPTSTPPTTPLQAPPADDANATTTPPAADQPRAPEPEPTLPAADQPRAPEPEPPSSLPVNSDEDAEGRGLAALSLKELLSIEVETSSKKLENIDFAPNTIYVITKEDIARNGYHTLGEVLRVVPGFGVFEKDIQSAAQVRGIAPNENEKIAWLVNGRSIGSIQPDLLNGPIDVTIFERVEIIVGPGSVLYGADSILATVNLITRKIDNDVFVVAGGNQTGVATAMFGTKRGSDEYLTATVTAMTKRGWDAWPTQLDHGGVGAPDLTGSTNTGKLYPSLFMTLSGQLGSWSINATARNETMPDLKHATIIPGSDGKRWERVETLGISHTRTWTKTITSGLELDYSDKRQLRVFTGADPTLNGESSYDNAQSTGRAEYYFRHKIENSYFQVGLQGRMDQNRNNYVFTWAPQNSADVDPAHEMIQPFLQMRDVFGLGVYASEEYQVRPDLKLVAAARWDKSTLIGFDKNYVSPRAAVIYSPRKDWTTKLIFNTATRLPDGIEGPLNAVWGIGNPAAPSWASVNTTALRPEVLKTLEWQNILNVGRTRGTLSLYGQHLDDFISWGGPWTNVGDFVGYGGELSVKSQIDPTLTVWGNASFQRTSFKVTSMGTSFGNAVASDKGEMNSVPALTLNVGGTWEFMPGYFASPTIRYFTHQPTWYWTSADPPNGTGYWGYSNNRAYVDLAVHAVDVSIKGLDLTLSGTNLLNNTATVGSQYLQGRNRPLGVEVLLEATYRLH